MKAPQGARAASPQLRQVKQPAVIFLVKFGGGGGTPGPAGAAGARRLLLAPCFPLGLLSALPVTRRDLWHQPRWCHRRGSRCSGREQLPASGVSGRPLYLFSSAFPLPVAQQLPMRPGSHWQLLLLSTSAVSSVTFGMRAARSWVPFGDVC